MRLHEKKTMRLVRNATTFFILLAIAYFIYGQFILPKDTISYDLNLKSFNDAWYEVLEDGTREKISLPGSYNNSIVMEATLPSNLGKTGCYIEFRGEKTDIYVDGKLRLSYDNKDTRAFSKQTTECYVMLQLNPEDAGKTITVKMTGLSGVLYPVNMGSLAAIWATVFRKYGGEFVIALMTVFLGTLAIICSLFLKKNFAQITPLIYLSMGISMGALWIICNSALRELYFNNIGMATDMCFIMIMLTPFPILIYLNELQQGRNEIAYFIACVIEAIVFVLCTTLHVIGMYDFHETFGFMAVGCFIAIVLIGVTIILDFKNKKIHEYRYVAIGLLCVVIATAVQLLAYSFRSDAFSGVFLASGLMIMLIFAVIHTMQDAGHMMQLKRDAEHASEAKGMFLANMSHEIRTPINAVLGMNEMILRETKEENTKEYATDIKAAGSSLLSLVNDILDFSKIEAGKMDLVPVEYDFAEMIYAVIIMSRPKAESKGLYFKLEIDKDIPRGLFGDDVRIRQVILNILSNAVKYTDVGGITFRISSYYIMEDIMLNIEVEDTGIGIKEEDIEKLYSEFERFDQSKNHMVEGTGLGMSITNRLLAMMGSHLEVTSKYGKGSCFSFKIRQKVVNHESIGEISEEGRKHTVEVKEDTILFAPDTKVLVVDDKAINRKVFCSLIKRTKMQVDQADSGKECLDKVQQQKYDIIFLDHMMPDMDGIETLHHMRKMTSFDGDYTKVIVLTANAIKGAREQYLAEGFDDYLSKPIVPEQLNDILRKYLKEFEEVKEEVYIDADKKEELPEWMSDSQKESFKANFGHMEESMAAKDEIADILETKSLWELLGEIEEIDVVSAAQYNPDEDILKDVLEGFYQALDSDADYLENVYGELQNTYLLQEADEAEKIKNFCVDYRIRVHAMKSSAKMIGAVKLSEEAFELEQASREENVELIFEKSNAFLAHWRKYKEYLAFMESSEQEEATTKLDAAQYKKIICSIFQMLNDAMEELDIDQADGIVLLLKQYQFPESLIADVKKLEQAVSGLDIEGTKELTETISGNL